MKTGTVSLSLCGTGRETRETLGHESEAFLILVAVPKGPKSMEQI